MKHAHAGQEPRKKNPGLTWGLSIGLILAILISIHFGVMLQFMGLALLLLAILKLLDIKGFVAGFAMYDLLAAKSKAYAHSYPFIEFALGLMFLLAWQVNIAATITLIIFGIGTAGVLRTLSQKKRVYCACVGTIIKLPLTTFTLIEDLSMVSMSIMILLGL